MSNETYKRMCISEIKKTKASGADLESTLNFLHGWFVAEVKSGGIIEYSSKDVLDMIEAILGKEK